jgi:DNA-binding transcriptional LysR family regulator
VADLTGFDLNLLRVFAVLMRERSVTRAGERLAMSQPAVSAALARLRHALDDRLFVRRGNDMVPTKRAEDLLGPVQDALDRLDAALQGRVAYDPAKAERTYTLLGSDYFSLLLMPELSRRIAGLAPGVRLRLVDFGQAAVERLLQEDTIDLVVEGPLELPRWVSRELLFRSPFAVVAPPGLPALVEAGTAPGEAFPIDAFCVLPHALRTISGGMSGYTDEALAKLGRSRRVTLAVPHFHAVLLAVARGGMIGVVPRSFAAAFAPSLGLCTYAPPIPMPSPEIAMYWHERHDRAPAQRWLRRQVVEALRAVHGDHDDSDHGDGGSSDAT